MLWINLCRMNILLPRFTKPLTILNHAGHSTHPFLHEHQNIASIPKRWHTNLYRILLQQINRKSILKMVFITTVTFRGNVRSSSVKRLEFVRWGRKLGFYCRPPYPRPPFVLCFVSPLNKSRVIRLSYQLTVIVPRDNFFYKLFILIGGVEMGWDIVE